MRVRWLIVLAACGHPPAREPVPTSGEELTFYRDVTVVKHGGSTYKTTAVHWEASYTLTAAPGRDRAVLFGTLALRNAGAALHGHAMVIDAELAHLDNNVDAADLGAVTVSPGESHVAFLSGSPHRVHPVLIYDPIGTKLDNPSAIPLRDASLGVSDPVSSTVNEGLEIERTRGLPGGALRVIEQGTGRVLGEGRLSDESTRRAGVDTIAIGTAEGVTGKRERRELTDEESRRRLVEEFVIEIDNARMSPVEVVVREHLYRGQTWAVAYQSVPDVHQDGAQAFTMRTRVQPRGQVKIMYVVVYTWGP